MSLLTPGGGTYNAPMSGDPSFATRCVHAGDGGDTLTTPLSPPLHLSSVFETPTLDVADRAMDGEAGQYIYRRIANPNLVAFERAMAGLEGAEAAVATASGMGAIATLFAAVLSAGDHVLASRDLYGTTTMLLSGPLASFGVETTFADASQAGGFESSLRPNTRLVYVETVSNPLMRIADIPALAELAHRHNALLAVDATFTTPSLSRPLAQGADVVMHSATKYLGGHSDVMAGVIVGTTETMERLRATRTAFGATCSSLDAWLALRGLKTLSLRMERHAANALGVAEFLAAHAKVRRVSFAGLASDPDHALAQRLLPRGPGGMLSFEIDGGRDAVARFLGGLRMIRFAASLGDVSTTVSYPAMTSHRGIAPEERLALGIGDGLIRVSTGIESLDDIIHDLARGLAAV